VVWPDGHQLTLGGMDADQTLVVRHDQVAASGGGCSL
jgi:hypothetical protein